MPRVFSVTVELRYPSEPEVFVDITSKVMEVYFKESLITGRLEWHLIIAADTINSENKLLFERGIRELKLSMNRDGVEDTTDWRVVVIESFVLDYAGDLPIAVVKGSDLSVFFMGEHRWQAYNNLPVLSILNAIASRNGLTLISEVDFVGTWLQTGQTDWEILQQIRNEVVSASGQRNLWLYVQDKFLYFSPVQYSSPSFLELNIGAGDDRVHSVTFNANGRIANYMGASSLRTSGYDILNKQFLEHTPLDAAIPSLAGNLPFMYGENIRYQTTPHQKYGEVVAQGATDWSDITTKYFSAHVRTVGVLKAKLGRIFSIAVEDTRGNQSVLGGRYPIYEIIHHYTTQENVSSTIRGEDFTQVGLTTHLAGFRRTSFFQSTPELKARGANFSKIPGRDSYSVSGELKTGSIKTLVSQDI